MHDESLEHLLAKNVILGNKNALQPLWTRIKTINPPIGRGDSKSDQSQAQIGSTKVKETNCASGAEGLVQKVPMGKQPDFRQMLCRSEEAHVCLAVSRFERSHNADGLPAPYISASTRL